MELNITKKEEKPLLSRTEILADMVFDAGIPKKDEIKEKLAAMTKADSSLIVVKKVYSVFGHKDAKVLAFAYTNEKDMKTIEPKPKEKKGAKKEEEKAPAEAPKEEKKEAPKEEKKEEKKEEPKEEKK